MTALFFLYLAVVQVAIGVVGVATAVALSCLPSMRGHRAQMIGAAAWGAAGGFLGTIGGFILVLIAVLSWLGIRYMSLVAEDAQLPEYILWAFPMGYVLGLAGGAVFGWRRAAWQMRKVMLGKIEPASSGER